LEYLRSVFNPQTQRGAMTSVLLALATGASRRPTVPIDFGKCLVAFSVRWYVFNTRVASRSEEAKEKEWHDPGLNRGPADMTL
jgi:hypothetical protein